MDSDAFVQREAERAIRLSNFVKDEVRNMYVGARFNFVSNMLEYFLPEIKELIRQNDKSVDFTKSWKIT